MNVLMAYRTDYLRSMGENAFDLRHVVRSQPLKVALLVQPPSTLGIESSGSCGHVARRTLCVNCDLPIFGAKCYAPSVAKTAAPTDDSHGDPRRTSRSPEGVTGAAAC
jgi:hypothetical protein